MWACPECQGRMHIHEYTERRWRHLDSCQFKTIIVSQVPRVQCREHGTQQVQVPWAEKQGRFTKLFERFAIAVLQECSISAASGLLKISWDEADGIKQRAVKRGLERKEENVPERYSNILGGLKGKKLKTARGWALKESIRGLWKCSTEKEGQVFFAEWYSWAIRSRLEPVKKVARMMKRHLPNIVSYCKHRITNAINNKIQSLIKKAYGYRNTDRFKNDILFHCGGLNLYPEVRQ